MSLVLRIFQLCLAGAQWAEVGQRLPIPLALVPPYGGAGVALMMSAGELAGLLTDSPLLGFSGSLGCLHFI